METLKNKFKNEVKAICNEKTCYIVESEKITKQFPRQFLKIENWENCEKLSEQKCNDMLYDFGNKMAKLQRENELKQAEKAKAEYEERKNFNLNLRKWRHYKVECYAIVTYFIQNSYFCESASAFGHSDYELFFDKNLAEKRFDELKESHTPDKGEFFVTELVTYNNSTNRLTITDRDELIDYITSNYNAIQTNEYAPELDTDEVIVSFERGDFNRLDKFHSANFPHQSDRYGLDTTTTAGISENEVIVTIADGVNQYGQEFIDSLELTREQAVEYGVEEFFIEMYFCEISEL